MTVRIDYSNCMASRIGTHLGLPDTSLKENASMLSDALDSLKSREEAGDAAFLHLPRAGELKGMLDFVEETSSDTEEITVLGADGSVSGGRALHGAWSHPMAVEGKRVPRVRFFDGVDPDTVSAIRYGAPSLASTQIHVTCDQRGGEAVAAACSAIRQLLRQEHLAPRNHLVMHVDPSCGLLLDFSRREGARVFPLPRGVHGPWHILAAAALLPSMFLEFDFPQFLDGARRMAARCHNTDLSANPAAILAHLWSLGRPALQAGYSALSDLARWFLALQEDADARDPLPLFVNVETPRVDFKIEGESATTLGRVVSERLEAQAAALARAGRPSLTISIKRARESDVGALVFLLLFASALARELRINAGDLPQSAEPPAPPAQNARQYLV